MVSRACSSGVLRAMDSSVIVVVLGATGVGKSKLAVHLAKRFDGEIINADVMQMYKGLDIVTNKVTEEERSGIPHHLLDFLSPNDRYIIKDFQRDCLKTISEIQSRHRLPILVGGTNYYIESILWNILLDISTDVSAEFADTDDRQLRQRLEAMSDEERIALLRQVDPERAKAVHPRNYRGVCRALEVYMKTQRPISQYLHEQRSARGAHKRYGGGLRFPHACLLWLTCQQDRLKERLDSRVDAMLERGLIDELSRFYLSHVVSSPNAECAVSGAGEFHGFPIDGGHDAVKCLDADSTNDRVGNLDDIKFGYGVFQAIGFKEFYEYLAATVGSKSASDSCDSHSTDKLLAKSIELLKIATRRYARKQNRWVRSRLLDGSRDVPEVFRLDTTDLSAFESAVIAPAIDIVDSLRGGVRPQYPPESPTVKAPDQVDDMLVRHCPLCDVHVSGTRQYSQHMASRKHRNVVSRIRARQMLGEAPWL